MNRRLSVLLLGALGAAAVLVAPGGEGTEAAETDPAAVERYLAQLSDTVPRPAAAKLADTPPPEDAKLDKTARTGDRAERILGAVLSTR